MFVIDFDDTLFRTQQFKNARNDALQRVGISHELCQKSYEEARKSFDGLFTYSDERHAAVLEKYGFAKGFAKDGILTALQKITATAKDFLDPEATVFLESLYARKEPLVLLSLGDPSFQELKVKGSGVAKYFERLYMVDQNKESVMTELVARHSEQRISFINDKVEETQNIARLFPHVRCVLKISPAIDREIYKKCGLVYFDSLLSIADYVAQQS